jgi:hypothetical protein
MFAVKTGTLIEILPIVELVSTSVLVRISEYFGKIKTSFQFLNNI